MTSHPSPLERLSWSSDPAPRPLPNLDPTTLGLDPWDKRIPTWAAGPLPDFCLRVALAPSEEHHGVEMRAADEGGWIPLPEQSPSDPTDPTWTQAAPLLAGAAWFEVHVDRTSPTFRSEQPKVRIRLACLGWVAAYVAAGDQRPAIVRGLAGRLQALLSPRVMAKGGQYDAAHAARLLAFLLDIDAYLPTTTADDRD